jgi:hypothetical protein
VESVTSRSFRFLAALGIGVLLTATLEGAAYCAFEINAKTLARVLSWPNTVLQSLIPCLNIGTLERPVCEGTPLNLFAFIVSIPLGVATYSAIAYFLLQRRAAASRQ